MRVVSYNVSAQVTFDRRVIRLTIFILASLVLLNCCPHAAGQSLPITYYTTSDGLQSNRIRAIAQDMKGYLWIGTNNGVNVFDGITFRSITPHDGLSNEYISGIIPSRVDSDVVWIGTIAGGVSRYDHGRFSTILFGNTTDSNNAVPLIEDAAGRLWVANSFNLYVVQGTTPSLLRNLGKGMNGVGAVELDRHKIAVVIDDSLFVYDTKSLTIVSRMSLACPPGVVITDVVRSTRGLFWVLLSNGDVAELKNDSLQVQARLGNLNLQEMYDGKDGTLWFAGQQGMYHLLVNQQPVPPIISFETTTGFPPLPSPALVDRENNLWIGSWASGLARLSDPTIITLPGPTGSSEGVKDGTCDVNGHVWMITANELIEAANEDGAWKTYRHNLGSLFPGEKLSRIVADSSGRLWLRYSREPVLRAYKATPHPDGPSTLEKLATVSLGFNDPLVAGLYFIADSRNRIWCSIELGGIAVYDVTSGKLLRKFTTIDSIPSGSIRMLFEDRDGNIWCGGFVGGLSVLEQGDLSRKSLRHYGISDGLPDDGIRSMTQDREGRLWVGTRFGGVALFDGVRFRAPGFNSYLRSDAIWGLTDDSRGRLWLGTDIGLESVARDSGTILPGKRDLTRNLIYRLGNYKDQFIWGITPFDAVVYDYPRSHPADVPPPVHINRFVVNGTPIAPVEDLALSHDQNNCIIEFVGISFRDVQGVRYQYRLGDVDPDWLPPTDHHSVTYANLKPGEYTFLVRALNGDGVLSTQPARLAFTIVPAFWQRWWFLPLLGMLLTGIVFTGVARRFQVLGRERRMQEQFSRQLIESQEKERQRIAGELHDSIGQNLLIIKNQAMIGLDPPGELHSTGETLKTISDIASQSISEVREIAHNLRPYLLDKLGLTKGLHSVIRKVASSANIVFETDIDDADGLLSHEDEIHLYRIIQETINNIVSHSAASKAFIALKVTDHRIMLNVSDNGKGFEAPASVEGARSHGFGIAGIAERVRMLKGTFEIRSAPGEGTKIAIAIPTRDHESE